MPVAPDVRDVEISVVSTDNRSLLERCLRSLPAACEGLAWRANVIDNASTDGTAKMVERHFPWAELLRNETRLGFSANHNKVIGPVLADDVARYVLVLNEDTELDPGAVAGLVAHADAHPRVGVAGPAIFGTDGRRQPSFFHFPRVWAQVGWTLFPGRVPRPPARNGWLNGSCLLVRVSALREVGPLDERFFIFYEDTDLGYRMFKAGWESVMVESVRILHHGHQTVSKPALGSAMERQMLRSRYLYFRKHRGRVAAGVVSQAVRGALLLRACRALLGRGGRRQARLLAKLARHSPHSVLPHERRAS